MMMSRTKAESQSLPGCSDRCGNITIPYPFVIEEDCYLSREYKVNCTTLRLPITGFKLLDISLDGLMHGLLPMTYACYNSTHKLSRSNSVIWTDKFLVSSTMNLLTTVGCDTRANIVSMDGEDSITIVATKRKCNSLYDCSFVFKWAVGNGDCEYSQKDKTSYICKENSVCIDARDFGYNCHYAPGYRGNPYLPNGCQVVIEWTVGHNDCKHSQQDKRRYVCKENSVCIDSQINGGYNCRCAPGYQGNPYLPNGCQVTIARAPSVRAVEKSFRMMEVKVT
ncbi:hypothetical protein L1987_79655 [Smallanthus sonchifolius]|uniref:Uncharacterized protein n=1 Tax=Smallanthus sonchifolius TaxID=185202 RepID=A0ACB8YKJ3_9ASTR|nr:hypothetical protein L1987_79655 [Smallanthus sonchifolius]